MNKQSDDKKKEPAFDFDYMRNAQELHEHQVADLKNATEVRNLTYTLNENMAQRQAQHLEYIEECQNRWASATERSVAATERSAAALERVADVLEKRFGSDR